MPPSTPIRLNVHQHSSHEWTDARISSFLELQISSFVANCTEKQCAQKNASSVWSSKGHSYWMSRHTKSPLLLFESVQSWFPTGKHCCLLLPLFSLHFHFYTVLHSISDHFLLVWKPPPPKNSLVKHCRKKKHHVAASVLNVTFIGPYEIHFSTNSTLFSNSPIVFFPPF